MRIFNYSYFIVLSTALLTACPEKDDMDSDGSTGVASTGEQGSSTTEEPTGTTGEATTGSTGEQESSTGGEEETSTGGATTGGVEGDGCESQCANQAACAGAPEEGCVETCRQIGDVYGYSGAACRAIYEEIAICLGAATCEELQKPEPACEAETAALIDEACTIPACVELCDNQSECGFIGEDERLACAVECTTGIGWATIDLGPACGDAGLAAMTCAATLSCQQLADGTGCDAEFAAQAEACGG